jgi:SagB-type dehydrogenase family enzyme
VSEAARRYHERTKHTPVGVRRSAHPLDWANRPHPFKDYVGLEPQPVPEELEELLRWGAGVVRSRSYGPDTYHFRTYSSAGALYPVEVYVAGATGLYHYHPLEHALRRLRRRERDPAQTALVLTGILWRTAWKYGLRGYRHLYWDAGTMLANLLAVAGGEARVLTGFVDAEVNAALDLDGEREAALALLALGAAEPTFAGELEPLAHEVAPLFARERPYPEAYELHRATSLGSPDEVARYQSEPPGAPESWPELERVLRRRGSVRDFALEPIAQESLARILARACGPIPADAPPCAEAYLVANAVEGLDPGTYRFEPPERFELLRRGSFRAEAGFLVLEQELGARSSATVFFLADLERVLDELGERGYRAAQLEGGIRSGRIYLGAGVEGLAATASTFYDDEVTRFFAPGTAKTPLLCAAVGRRP